MSVGFVFWLLLLLALIFGFVYRDRAGGPWPIGMSLFVWILFFLIGVAVFGWPIKA